jgi:hypothetical protein
VAGFCECGNVVFSVSLRGGKFLTRGTVTNVSIRTLLHGMKRNEMRNSVYFVKNNFAVYTSRKAVLYSWLVSMLVSDKLVM